MQNKVQRIITRNYDLNVATDVLLGETKDLSVNQLGAFHSVMTDPRIPGTWRKS